MRLRVVVATCCGLAATLAAATPLGAAEPAEPPQPVVAFAAGVQAGARSADGSVAPALSLRLHVHDLVATVPLELSGGQTHRNVATPRGTVDVVGRELDARGGLQLGYAVAKGTYYRVYPLVGGGALIHNDGSTTQVGAFGQVAGAVDWWLRLAPNVQWTLALGGDYATLGDTSSFGSAASPLGMMAVHYLFR